MLGYSVFNFNHPAMPRMPPASLSQRLQHAVALKDDAASYHLLERILSEEDIHRAPTAFAALAAAGMPRSAVLLAQAEAGSTSLRDAEATETGGTYLHAAAAAGASASVVAALMEAGCPLQQHDDAGDTALHVAAQAGHVGSCQALVEAGADALARNKSGRTPRSQGGVLAEVKVALLEAEEACRQHRAAKQLALWDSRMRSAQTSSACLQGCT